jgi:tetratricopeptide (TPR) repeat protein
MINYDDSPYINYAYRLRSEELFRKKNYEQARATANEALAAFGAVRGLGWAQVMDGRVEMELGNYPAAVESFSKVFNAPQWRGPRHAEATCRVADAWFAQNNWEKAFAWYQRTYLLYNAYDDGLWAADAYLKSAECLRKLSNKTEVDVENTYRAMLLDESVRSQTDKIAVAIKYLGQTVSDELLARTVEGVEVEQE